MFIYLMHNKMHDLFINILKLLIFVDNPKTVWYSLKEENSIVFILRFILAWFLFYILASFYNHKFWSIEWRYLRETIGYPHVGYVWNRSLSEQTFDNPYTDVTVGLI